jgi:hypothetical protein
VSQETKLSGPSDHFSDISRCEELGDGGRWSGGALVEEMTSQIGSVATIGKVKS